MDEAKSRILGEILAKTDQRVTARHWLLDDGDPPAPAVLLIIHEEFIVWRAKEVGLSTRWRRGLRRGEPLLVVDIPRRIPIRCGILVAVYFGGRNPSDIYLWWILSFRYLSRIQEKEIEPGFPAAQNYPRDGSKGGGYFFIICGEYYMTLGK